MYSFLCLIYFYYFIFGIAVAGLIRSLKANCPKIVPQVAMSQVLIAPRFRRGGATHTEKPTANKLADFYCKKGARYIPDELVVQTWIEPGLRDGAPLMLFTEQAGYNVIQCDI